MQTRSQAVARIAELTVLRHSIYLAYISRPTPRLLSFALCLEWINGIYNIPDTDCLECYRPHASVNTTTPKIDRKHIHCRNMLEIRTRYIPWKYKIVNKRPRNLLNEIQSVFINGKQVKTVIVKDRNTVPKR